LHRLQSGIEQQGARGEGKDVFFLFSVSSGRIVGALRGSRRLKQYPARTEFGQLQTLTDGDFVGELHSVAAQTGYLPRPLQWAEYVIRVKVGGPVGGMPMRSPGDVFGLMSSVAAPCR